MAGLPPDAGDSTPRWVKVFVIVALALVLLFVIVHLTGNSPGGHLHGGHTPPASATEHGAHQP